MKHSLTIGLILAAFSTSAMAETPAPKLAEPAKAEKMQNRMKGRMERMWKEMDSNNDGAISKEESTAFGNKKFDEKDGNHDDTITREEWDAFHKAKMEEKKAKREAMKGKSDMPIGDKTPAAPADAKK